MKLGIVCSNLHTALSILDIFVLFEHYILLQKWSLLSAYVNQVRSLIQANTRFQLEVMLQIMYLKLISALNYPYIDFSCDECERQIATKRGATNLVNNYSETPNYADILYMTRIL